MAGTFGMAHDGANLGELLDGVPYLLVQYPAVRDDDGRVEERLAVLLQPNELVSQPSDRVGLATARRVLDEILGAHSPAGRVGQQLAHHVQLVIARPYLLSPLASGLVVPRLHDLSVVLDDVGEPIAGENLLPQVIGLEAIGVWTVALAVIPALVERQEPGLLAPQVGAETAPRGRPWRSGPSSGRARRASPGGCGPRLYCSTASSTVCLVRLFFSSKVATGSPLTNRHRSNASCALSLL